MSDGREKAVLPYDYLVITTGSQYVPQKPTNGDIPTEGVFSVKCDDKQGLERARALIGDQGKNYEVQHTMVATVTVILFVV